jgi:hypothetical protein
MRMLFPDGSPEGIRIVEKSNWTGKCVLAPRSRFAEPRKREEFNKVGVYILVGVPNPDEPQQIYVGEGDLIAHRLINHHKNKDFWSTVVFFISKDDNLNKAHVQYLEASLVARAKEAKRCVLKNENVPQAPSLSEIDTAEMGGFLEQMLSTLSVLKIEVFEKPEEISDTAELLYLEAKGLKASGYESDAGFVVKAGSESPLLEVPTVPSGVKKLRSELKSQGVLAEEGNHLRMQQDYVFSSPSHAAAVILARSANGRIEWKDRSGRTLRAIQEAEAEE